MRATEWHCEWYDTIQHLTNMTSIISLTSNSSTIARQNKYQAYIACEVHSFFTWRYCILVILRNENGDTLFTL